MIYGHRHILYVGISLAEAEFQPLSPQEKEFLQLHVEKGYSKQDLMDEYNIGASRVSNVLLNATGKMRAYGDYELAYEKAKEFGQYD